MIKRLRLWITIFFESAYRLVRSFLGPDNVCIYPVTCSDYARAMLHQKPWYISFPMITLRLLSCNPLVGLVRRWWYKSHTCNKDMI